MIQTVPVQTQVAPAEAGGGARPACIGLLKSPSHHHHHHRRGPPITVSKSGQLKYADPRSLPSFPSYGLVPGGAAASAAASLGWSNQRHFEPWRPQDKTTASASTALLAKNNKMAPSREPATDDAGAKAAVSAAGSVEAVLKTTHVSTDDQHQVPCDDGLGSSAANAAFHANRKSAAETGSLSQSGAGATQASFTDQRHVRIVEPPPTANNDGSLAAAKGAMSVSKQPDADAPRASDNALNGATVAHRGSMRLVSVDEAGAIPLTTMTRDMYTSHPPVKLEVDELNNNERLHQSAVEMAQQMFSSQQQHQRTMSTPANGSSGAAISVPFPNLQDAAYRQAQERLERLHEEHEKNQEFKGFFPKEQAPRRRLSLMAKLRRRSTSSSIMDDRERSERRTVSQASMFPILPSRVEQDKREKDRQAILATAQRNVKAQLHDMDEKALQDAGRANPNISSEVETTAQHRAQAILHPADEHQGKIDIGGGKWMDATEIDAIAARRVRPMLDDIDGSIATERDRVAALKMDKENKRSEARRQKERERERKEMDKRFREEERRDERARKLHEKQEAKARKDESKAAKLEQKRQLKDEKRRLKINTAGGSQRQPLGADDHRNDETDLGANGNAENENDHENENYTQQRADSAAEGMESEPAPEQSRSNQTPSSPIMRMTDWLKSRFSRGKHAGNEGSERQTGFVGGAALQRSGDGNNIQSASSIYMRGGTSPRPETSSPETTNDRGHSLEAPRQLTDTPSQQISGSPARDSRFREEMDQ